MVSATTIPDGFNVKLRPEYLRSMSAEEFFCFCQDNPQLRLERSAEGEIIFMSPSGLDTGFAEGEIVGELIQWNRQKQLGRVSSPSGGYTLPNGAIRAADASFITFGRLEAVSAQDRKRFAPVVPNFVAEVVSPSDSLADQQAKMDEWIQNGVELGWLIDPQTEQVWIYQPSKVTVQHTDFDRSLSGELVLPGFTFDLKLLRG